MTSQVSIVQVQFRNFKTFRRFSLSLERMNVLVGPNNAGKSTIIGAFRVLAAGIQRANARGPELVAGPEGTRRGYPIAREAIPISIENVHTNYADTDTTVTFELSSGARLTLYFGPSGDCVMLTDNHARPIRGPQAFRSEFPVAVTAVPVLGPVEHEEQLVQRQTVQRNLATHRASRNFRNYWLQHEDDFDSFRNLVRQTWPEMDVLPPEVAGRMDPYAVMFCAEGEARIQRELFWVGFGFQVWCQLLTHILRAANSSMIVIDEPEIYLHPQLQRMLLSVLREAGPDVLIATHSSDLIQDADPSDILLIEKSRQSAKRIGGTAGTQEALSLVGSARNDVLTSAARTKRVTFIEGNEFKLLQFFSERIGLRKLARTSGITPIPLGGFPPPQQILARAQGITEALGESVQFAVVLDRDYRPEREIAEVLDALSKRLAIAHVHSRKEIENYLLVPRALDRAIRSELAERERRGATNDGEPEATELILRRLTEGLKHEVQGQYVGRHIEYRRRRGDRTDPAQTITETSAWFDHTWGTLEGRLSIVPGKRVLSLLNAHLQEEHQVTIMPRAIIGAMRPGEVAAELTQLLRKLDRMLA